MFRLKQKRNVCCFDLFLRKLQRLQLLAMRAGAVDDANCLIIIQSVSVRLVSASVSHRAQFLSQIEQRLEQCGSLLLVGEVEFEALKDAGAKAHWNSQ
jgi:hypothetical protein